MEHFPNAERERISRLRVLKDQALSAVGIKLMEFAGIPVDLLTRTAFNRPIVKDEEFNFNVSHAGDYVVLAYAENGQVGIDIEHKIPVDISDFNQVMTDEEITTCKTQDAFYRLWTSKEAVIKALGTGFQQDVREIQLEKHAAYLNGKKWFLQEIEIASTYHCTLATEEKPEKISIKTLSLEELVIQQQMTSK